MKKSLAISFILACVLPVAANARCPFNDYFSVSVPSPYRILNASTLGNIAYTQQSDNFFTLSCANDNVNNSGYVYVDVGTDDRNKCNLTIEDGPYKMNPSVASLYCIGNINYDGMDHRLGSYNYTLKFKLFR